MKKILILLFIASLTYVSYGQSYVSYTYDKAGNRITRQTIIIKNTEKNNNFTETSQINDVFGKGNVIIFPNPTDKLLTVQFENITIKNNILLQLFDINGKLIISKKTKNNRTELNLNKNAPGTYILEITSGKNRIEYTVIKK